MPAKPLSFDYIVIGGGTAGLVMAVRLAEKNTVAVIEAGGDYEKDTGTLNVIPGMCTVFAGTDTDDYNPLIDWGFATEPQTAADSRCLQYPRGKTLGGSSARNFMYYHRPTAGTLNKWAKEVGDDSYQFQNLLPYYNKSLTYAAPEGFAEGANVQDPQAWENANGPLQIGHGNYVDPLGTWVKPALEKANMAPIDGFQSGKLIGSGYGAFTIDPKDAHRSSSKASYLASAVNNPRLRVFDHTLTEKVLFDEHNTATGVLVFANDTEFELRAEKEVILSAGAFQSPQLLMLSGIGPKKQLDAFAIPTRIDLPGVGQNLADHPLFGVQHRVNIPTVSSALGDPAVMASAQEAWATKAAGRLAISAAGVIGWEKVPPPLRDSFTPSNRAALDAAFPADWPEVEYLPIDAAMGRHRNFLKEDPLDGHNYATIEVSMVAPLSRGTVTLASARATDLPRIDPQYLTHDADKEVAIAAIRRIRQIWAHLPDLTVGDEHLPGPHVQSDEEIFAWVKESLCPTWHASGTCKMGRKADRMAVVDHQAKVFGCQGLRVVDASAFPFLLPGHPQATVYALAEKIAEGILKEVEE